MNNSIYPCITLKGQVTEAADFYIKTFGAGSVEQTSPYVIQIQLSGQKFMLLNDGPSSKPNASISFMVVIQNERQLEEHWNSLTVGGEVLMALDSYPWSKRYGWIQDKYGVSWQLYLSDEKSGMQKFSPTLMFAGDKAGSAAEAVRFYTSVFPNSSITGILNYDESDGDRTDLVKHAQFEINNFVVMAMDSSGEQGLRFNEAISIVVECETQKEIDHYWESLTLGHGYELACGWLTDRFGVSWQIVPNSLGRLMSDPERGQRVMTALLKMKKLIIQDLEQA
jgi:predicted 3-demethylubiquinone-9 3-methyltransferase (glyoxalase superfamily)